MTRVQAKAAIPFTDADRVLVAMLWNRGDSAAVISRNVSGSTQVPRSRNSIISLVHRMGLPGRNVIERKATTYGARKERQAALARGTSNIIGAHEQEHERSVAPPTRQRHRGTVSTLTGYDAGAHKHAAPPQLIEVAEATSTQVPHLDATHAHCSWPASTDVRDMKVCGAKVTCGAYCDHHAGLAYRSPPGRRRAVSFHRKEEYYN